MDGRYPLESVRQKTHFTRSCHIIAQLGRDNSAVYTLAMTMVTQLNSHLSASLLLLVRPKFGYGIGIGAEFFFAETETHFFLLLGGIQVFISLKTNLALQK
jgi:hypothetical protein